MNDGCPQRRRCYLPSSPVPHVGVGLQLRLTSLALQATSAVICICFLRDIPSWDTLFLLPGANPLTFVGARESRDY